MRSHIELNFEHSLVGENYLCDKCNQEAIMECEVNIDKGHIHNKQYGVYCKDHYATLFDDLVEELNEPSTHEYEAEE